MERGTLQQPLRYDHDRISLDYLRFVPDADRWSPPWPLVLFLHGAGERGRDPDRVRLHGIPRVIDRGGAPPFVAISPQCPPQQWWTGLTEELRGLVDEVVDALPIDENRIYVTGISMGGYGAWKLAAETPERFAAVVPICGGGNPAWAQDLQRVPIWAFHGSDDDIVPVTQTLQMVSALQRVGAPVKVTIYDGVGHDSWTRTYDEPALYEWMLAQCRGNGATVARW